MSNRWPDYLESPTAQQMRDRSMPFPEADFAAMCYLFDQMEREIRVHREDPSRTHTPSPPAQMVVTFTQAECDELCEIAERDGYEKAVQEIDQLTGGDGEYRVSMLIGGGVDDERHTPDAPSMIQRIVGRFETLNVLREAEKTGRDQEWGISAEPHSVGGHLPEIPTWKDQAAFEEWAKSNGYEMHQHPLHYLFLEAKTNAARMGWKAGIAFARAALASASTVNNPATLEKSDFQKFDVEGERRENERETTKQQSPPPVEREEPQPTTKGRE